MYASRSERFASWCSSVDDSPTDHPSVCVAGQSGFESGESRRPSPPGFGLWRPQNKTLSTPIPVSVGSSYFLLFRITLLNCNRSAAELRPPCQTEDVTLLLRIA